MSECSADTLCRAHAVPLTTAVVVEYSVFCLVTGDPNIRLLEAARVLCFAVVAYGPMATVLLKGGLRKVEGFTNEGDLPVALP